MIGRRVDSIEAALFGEPGDYFYKPGGNSVWFQLPTGSMGRISVPPWDSITEHEDSTISISPSIQQHYMAPVNDWPGIPAWHGFLTRGEWTA